MTLALTGVLVAPRRWRGLLALIGSGLAVGVSYSMLMLSWHLPSDVLGGFLVAATWMSLAVAALRAAGARWPARSGREAVARAGRRLPSMTPLVWAVVLMGSALLAALRALDADIMHGRTAFLAGALLIAALAWALAAGLAAVLGARGSSPGSDPAPTGAPRRRWPTG
jgi:hypothetical protein